MSLRINPELQAVVAPLTTEEYAQLRDNIQKDGLLEPITLWAEESGTILDGHNRYAICQELGIGFRTKALSFLGIEAAKLWILEHQVGRRNLTDDQRAVIWNDIREQRAAVSRAAAIVKARDAKAAPGAVGDTVSPTKPRTIAAVVAESKIATRTRFNQPAKSARCRGSPPNASASLIHLRQTNVTGFRQWKEARMYACPR